MDMTLFDTTLKAEESLFKNPVALDYDYQPKLIPHREKEQHYIAACIKPLFQQRNGRNILIYGKPGIGKTVAVKHVFQELEEQYDEVTPLYINCWQKNTTYKVILELCELVGYRFTQNKKTEELFDEVKRILNKTAVAIAFDEIDKAQDTDFLYGILESIYRKTIILISNYKDWITQLDDRIRSRLLPELMYFREYNEKETRDILEQRMNYAFHEKAFEPDAFARIVQITSDLKDIRTGLYLLREAATLAEEESMRTVSLKHALHAIQKIEEIPTKNLELDPEEQSLLNIIKELSGKKIGELFKAYQEHGGTQSYKTFQRRIARLEEGKFVRVKTYDGGAEGSTSIISYQGIKKLTEF